MSKLDKEIKPSNAQPLKYKLAGSTLDESDRKSFKIPPHGACKKLNNNRPQEPSNNQYLISEATTDDSVLSRRETSMTKFEEKSSGGVPKDFLHSVAQNTFDNLECVTEASHLEAMDNNFAPPANTSLEENVKDIPTDDVLKTYQNSSARDTSENSKSSAETSHPGMQTVHSAVCTDEIAREESEAELDNLEKLRYKMPEETNTDSDPKSSSTRNDSAAYLASDKSTTKFDYKASDGAPKNLPHSMGQNTSNNPECLTKASHVEAIRNNFAPSTNTSVDVNVKDIPPDDVLKTSQNTSTRNTLENLKSSAETSHPGMQTVQLAVCTDEIAEEKSTKKLDHLNENQDDVLEETYHDLDLKSKQSSQNIREPTEIIPRDLKHNIPEAMTHDNFIVAHGKIKPSGTTDNTSIENSTKKSICTTKEVSLNGFLSITAILILVQTLTAVILTYNMKQQYDELEITLFNRLTGDHHKMPNEILLNKDDADAIKPLDEKRIKQIEKEIEITRNFTKQILEPRIGEEREKITKILNDLQSQVQRRLNELQDQINTLRNDYKALEGKDFKMENILLSIEKFVRKEIYDISLYMVVLLFVAVIVVFRVVYDKLKPKQPRAVDSISTVLADVSNGQTLKSGLKQKFSKAEQKLPQKNKEKGVGIISFNSSTQENHRRCFKALDIPSSLSVKAYVILQLNDLLLVQPYTQMVIFVDSNERNIILENSETEIGDIRRRTTEVLLEVGCDVFVVYYSDKDSKLLPKENLYNTSLYSINNHTVLSRLRSRGRVFSVYDTFHPQQVQMLKKCIK